MKQKTNQSYNTNLDPTFYVSDCFGTNTPNNEYATITGNNKSDYLVNYQLYSLPKTQPQLPPTELHNSTGVVAMLLCALFLIIFSLKQVPSYFKENFTFLLTDSNLDKQHSFREVFSSSCLYTISLLLLSILSFEKLSLIYTTTDSPLSKIIAFWVILILFFCLKAVIYKLYAYCLHLENELKQWSRISSVLMNTFTILVFFPVCIVIYSNMYHTIIINISLIVFLLVQLFLIIVVVTHFISKKSDYLYLFVYLCTVEILPYIFIGIVFLNLYKIDFI